MLTLAPTPTRSCRRKPSPTVGLSLAALLPLLGLAAGCGTFNAQARNAEGVRLFQQARLPEAIQQFQEALYADPSSPDAYYNLAAVYHRMGVTENQRANLDQAEQLYNQCLDVCDRQGINHPDCYRGLAVLLAQEGRTNEAFRLIEGWVARQPGVADAKIELARLCEEHGERRAAKEHLVDALAIDPNNPRALAALGKIREDLGEPTQALANYQRSLWYNQMQPQVASRVAILQSTLAQPVSTAYPGAGARLVDADRQWTPVR